jgi:membrane-bound lytic murein transglycosylase B
MKKKRYLGGITGPGIRLIQGLVILSLFSVPVSPSASLGAAAPKETKTKGQRIWAPLVKRLAADGLDQKALTTLFQRVEVRFDPDPMRHKMRALYKTMFGRRSILAVQKNLKKLGYKTGPLDGRYGPQTRRAILAFRKKNALPLSGLPDEALKQGLKARVKAKFKSSPGPRKKRKKFYRSALSKAQMVQTRKYLARHRPLLHQVRQKYGVPEEIAVGILSVETRVGTYLGRKRALTTLASMALCSDFKRVTGFFKKSQLGPTRKKWLKKRSGEKAAWAYEELKALLHYAQTNRADPYSLVGSIYGAIGISQFMPTNALKFGQDGDGDGRVDLFRHEDAVHSLGAYLKGHGWTKKMTQAKKREVLHTYNRSQTYVNTVLAVADYLTRTTKKGTPAARK